MLSKTEENNCADKRKFKIKNDLVFTQYGSKTAKIEEKRSFHICKSKY